MDLVCYRLHAIGEFVGVWDQIARAIARHGGPTVVKVDIEIAGIFETKADESFGGVDGDRCGGGIATSLVL